MRGAVEFRHRLMSIIPKGNAGSYDHRYMTIEALEDGLTAKMTRNALEYSVNGGEWVSLAANAETPAVSKGDFISFRGNSPSITSSNGIGTFTISKKCNLLGNCNSLLFGDNAEGSNLNANYSFYRLFKNNTNIVSVSKDFLPSTLTAGRCYYEMFYGCTSLTSAPDLSATNLANYCYYSMFYGCTSLTTVPSISIERTGNFLAIGCFIIVVCWKTLVASIFMH